MTLPKQVTQLFHRYFNSTFDKRKINSTNILERFSQKIRRRTKVVVIPPIHDAYICLVKTYVLEYTEDWLTEKAYFAKECILEIELIFKEQKLAVSS
ncbi:transposase [bacterium]|nr:transposase [bacterium]